jgi:protein-S-isoprenylcysteine O-methyltransferase Ste14
MDLYGQKSSSIPQKILIHVLEIIFIFLSWWILFGKGGNWFGDHLHITNAEGNHERRIILFVFNIIIFLRIAITMFFLIKRRIPWEESISVPMAFALYYVGFSLFVLPKSRQLDGLDYFAMILFIAGCVLNTGGEIMRYLWKKREENRGKLYTGGFFRYSRHINYFGDLLWVTAYALVTKNWWSATIILFLFCFFAFYNAPKLDNYLREKYGKQYEEYAAGTKMLVPFLL